MADNDALMERMAAGQLRRARELLAAPVASSDFDPDLLRRYAAVLPRVFGENSSTGGLVAVDTNI